MGGILSRLHKQDVRLLIAGLDAAGKTSEHALLLSPSQVLMLACHGSRPVQAEEGPTSIGTPGVHLTAPVCHSIFLHRCAISAGEHDTHTQLQRREL